MSRTAENEPELPWAFDEAVPDVEQDDPIGGTRSFRWRNHPGKIVLAAPFLAAVLTVSAWAVVPVAASWGYIPATAKETITFAAFIANWVLAIAGACAGGLLVRGRTDERVEAEIGAGVVGGFGYILAIIAVAAVMFCVSALFLCLLAANIYLFGLG